MKTNLKGGKLGREIKISPKTIVMFNDPFTRTFATDTVEVLIGIGKYHSASLTMDVYSWKALKEGAEINITTSKQFRKQFI